MHQISLGCELERKHTVRNNATQRQYGDGAAAGSVPGCHHRLIQDLGICDIYAPNITYSNGPGSVGHIHF